jgi:hypothetical protein
LLKEKIAEIKRSIDDVCAECGIERSGVKILAATKTVEPSRINLLPDCGITLAGENRVSEFVEKRDFVKGIDWHFIGALQTNKVKHVVGKVSLIHSVDRESLADEIDRLSKKAAIVSDVLIEVNVGEEASKSGVLPEGLDKLCDYCAQKSNMRVRGFMSVLPKDADERLYEKLYNLYAVRRGGAFDTLSAGMSGDYITAIRHGANLVRLGSIIFGQRT